MGKNRYLGKILLAAIVCLSAFIGYTIGTRSTVSNAAESDGVPVHLDVINVGGHIGIVASEQGRETWMRYGISLNPLKAKYSVFKGRERDRKLHLVDSLGRSMGTLELGSSADPWWLQGDDKYLVFGKGASVISGGSTQMEQYEAMRTTFRLMIVNVEEMLVAHDLSIVEYGFPIRVTSDPFQVHGWLDTIAITNLREYMVEKSADLEIEVRRYRLSDLKKSDYAKTKLDAAEYEWMTWYFRGFGSGQDVQLGFFPSRFSRIRWGKENVELYTSGYEGRVIELKRPGQGGNFNDDMG